MGGEGMTPSRLRSKTPFSPWQSPFPLQGEGLGMTGRHYNMVDRGGGGMTPSRLLAKAKPSPWQSPFPLQREGLGMTGRHYNMVDGGRGGRQPRVTTTISLMGGVSAYQLWY